jgi:purine-binding chemotaxis protein CheW
MENQQMQKTLDQVIQRIDDLLAAVPLSASRSAAADVPDETAVLHKYVLIGLGSCRLAVPMEGLVEVGSRPAVTPLPNLPAWILGIVNLRSEIISVIDLAAFLDLPAARTQSGERFAVIRYRDVRAGIPIDRIYGTVNKSRNMQTMPLHPEIKKENAVYFAAGGFVEDEQLYSILDVKHLFSSRRFLNFQQVT